MKTAASPSNELDVIVLLKALGAAYDDVALIVRDDGDFIEFNMRQRSRAVDHEAAYQHVFRTLQACGLRIGETEVAVDLEGERLTGAFFTRPLIEVAAGWPEATPASLGL